jgi:peroxiredoxin Q/BCP
MPATETPTPPDLQPGDKAPLFEVTFDGAQEVGENLRGHHLVLYFYPKDDTPGCTAEAKDFRDRLAEFAAADAVVIGISRDPVKRHDRFKAKYGLTFPLGSDESGAACEAYGVWREKVLAGRKYMGIVRTTFLVDRTGVIRRVWRKVKVAGHAAEVLAAVQALPPG